MKSHNESVERRGQSTSPEALATARLQEPARADLPNKEALIIDAMVARQAKVTLSSEQSLDAVLNSSNFDESRRYKIVFGVAMIVIWTIIVVVLLK